MVELKKNCSWCGINKSIDEFHKGTGKLKRASHCKLCRKERVSDSPEWKKSKNENRIKRRLDPEFRKREAILDRKNRLTDLSRYLFKSAKARALKRGLDFNIVKEDINIPKFCPLLGLELTTNEFKAGGNSISLDRIDNSKGYVKGNVWVISRRANAIKNDATLEELEILVKNLKKFWVH